MVRMLAPAAAGAERGEWAVLVMDPAATRVASAMATMSELMEQGVSLVEDLHKRREPLPAQDAVYFLAPTPKSVDALVADFAARDAPNYRAAHVFFTSSVPTAQLHKVKACAGLLARVKTLKEVNMDFMLEDGRTMLTPSPLALECCYAEGARGSASAAGERRRWAQQLATVFATLGELPAVRYASKDGARAGDRGDDGFDLATFARDVHGAVGAVARRAAGMPAVETCELLVLGRAFDPVAPAIHEWTYEAMAYDLLRVRAGGVYRYEVETNAGTREPKDAILSESDSLWVNLRHMHLAEASIELNKLLESFNSNSKATKLRGGGAGGSGGTISMRDLKKTVSALPQYRDKLTKLALHIDVASKLNTAVRERALKAAGEVEQDIVYGDATSKELIALLSMHGEHLSKQDKLRVLMCYAATHPEKLDKAKRQGWMKLARLSEEDMDTVVNLEHLGVAVNKRSGLKAMVNIGRKRRAKAALRKERGADDDGEGEFGLARFTPLLSDIIEDAARGELSVDEFPYVTQPRMGSPLLGAGAGNGAGGSAGFGASGGSGSVHARGSVRSARSTASWATRGATGALATGAGAGTASASSRARRGGADTPARRLFVYIAGGASRSEMRVVHKLAESTGMDIMLVTTSIDTPETFIANVAGLSGGDGLGEDF